MPVINLPTRVAFVDANGRLTPEAYRALRGLVEQVNNTGEVDVADLETLAAFAPAVTKEADAIPEAGQSAQIAELRKQIEGLEAALAAVLARSLPDDVESAFVSPATDWEHPGKLGERKPNSAKVTSLTASGGFGCNGQAAQTTYALGAAATDLASVITLANNLRLMAVANGMGS